MPTVAIRIDVPPQLMGTAQEGCPPGDAQMTQDMVRQNAFVEAVSGILAALPERPPRRSGNVSDVELLGTVDHYLLLVSVDIGNLDLDLSAVLPPGADYSVVGGYDPIESWPSSAG
jgi:hypothetical protein